MNVFKLELKRAIFNKYMLISLALGLALTAPHAIMGYFRELEANDITLEFNLTSGADTTSLFGRWFGMSGVNNLAHISFFFILSLLAVLPASLIYFNDRKSGYVKNLYTRYPKFKCLLAKYISTFTSGFVAIVLPLIISLMISALYAPMRIPDPVIMNQIHELNMWSQMFYTNPLLYTLLYIMLDGIFAGLFGVLAMSMSEYVEHRFSVFISSFLIVMAGSFLFKQFDVEYLNPQLYLSPGQLATPTMTSILIEAIVLLGISSGLFFIGGMKHETY